MTISLITTVRHQGDALTDTFNANEVSLHCLNITGSYKYKQLIRRPINIPRMCLLYVSDIVGIRFVHRLTTAQKTVKFLTSNWSAGRKYCKWTSFTREQHPQHAFCAHDTLFDPILQCVRRLMATRTCAAIYAGTARNMRCRINVTLRCPSVCLPSMGGGIHSRAFQFANRLDSLCESIRFVKNRPFDSLVVMQFLH